VLVTGASGSVGLFACQLAALSGAIVTGQIRQAKHEPMLRRFGVNHVVTSEDARGAQEFGPYRLVLESIGGPVLWESIKMLGQDGICVVFGMASGQDTTMSARHFFTERLSQRVQGMSVFRELSHEPAGLGLSRLLQLVARKKLRPHIGAVTGWEEIGTVAQDLLAGKIAGKAVLHLKR
jgi:NADPH:quinone reductase-like Zn-dependent oxidoreductase